MNIRDYEALSHGGQDWTEAFRAAIDALRAQGGGVLTVTPGVYPTGSIRLYDNMTLDVQSGAVIRFHQDPDAFPLIDLEFEGRAVLMHQACIFAQHAQNVAISGYGVIDGQGEYWWKRLREHSLIHYRPYLVCFADCRRVVLENVTLTNSPAWTVHPLRCQHVTCRGLMVRNPYDGPNTDGINPDACTDVRIIDCTIDVGDDCIAIKSGTEDTPNPQPCERIIIEGCHFVHGHGGVVLGSEMSGNIRNVVVGNCVFHQTDRGVRLKTRRGRGGVVEGVQLFNLVMEKVMCPFVFNMYYGCGDPEKKWPHINDKTPCPVDKTTPALRDVVITGVRARQCGACAGFFYGLPEMPVEGVTMNNVVVEMDPNGTPDYPAMMKDAVLMQGAGFFLRNARNVDLRGVRVVGAKGDTLDMDDSVETC
ncbi:MAG: glycoside hydrolase family 28 protein [Clostridia bacterium]|nr:glycoside hydrolase family 28 protein [Clostridia bacterium]